MSGGRGRVSTFLVLVLVLVGAGLLWWWLDDGDGGSGGEGSDGGGGGGGGQSDVADLYSMTSAVERLDAQTSARETVPTSTHRDMAEGDGVTVDDAGRAQLAMGGCVFDVFRNTQLQVQKVSSQSAPVCLVHNSHGTVYSKVTNETKVGTDWATVTAYGTEFLVYVNEEIGLVWVIVADGYVEVEAAGVVVGVNGGEQAWVWRGDPPVGPVPAWRSEVPDQDVFPLIPDLTNGEIADGALLAAPGEPTAEALGVALEPSTDALEVPECAGDKELVLVARLTGPDDAVAQVTSVQLAYGWDGKTIDVFGMQRLDDRTFQAVIAPDSQLVPITTGGTVLVYTVTVRGPNREVLVEGEGKAALSYCIG